MSTRARLTATTDPERAEFESLTVPNVPQVRGINKNGSTWHSGTGVPVLTLGVVTDWYLDKANGDIYEKTGVSTWVRQFNFSLLDTAVATGLHITRAQIPSVPVLLPRFTISGNTTPGDLGSGATYKLGTSGGPRAIQDALGTWFELDLSGGWGRLGWFGAVGNGVADDDAAVQLAMNTLAGKVVEIEQATFSVNSITVPSHTIVRGSKLSVIKRKENAPTSYPVISIENATGVRLRDFTVDGNKTAQTQAATNIQMYQSWDILIERVSSNSAKSVLGGYGTGFAVVNSLDRDNETQTIIDKCRARGNDATGVLTLKSWNVHVLSGNYSYNTGAGIAFGSNYNPIVGDVDNYCTAIDNHCHHNGSGIVVGSYVIGYSASGANIYGTGTPSSRGCVVRGNTVNLCSGYGIAFTSANGVCSDNVVSHCGSVAVGGAACILFNGIEAVLSNNTVVDGWAYGIDAGGSVYCTISGNRVKDSGATSGIGACGINLGASIGSVVSGNNISSVVPGTGIALWGIDGDGLTPFPWLGAHTKVCENKIELPNSGGSLGIWVARNFGVAVVNDNYISSAETPYAFDVDGLSQSGNRVFTGSSNESATVNSSSTMLIPDAGDLFTVAGSTTINSILTRSAFIFNGRVRDVLMTAMGSGYDPANKPTVTFSGGGGSGAAATAEVDNGGRLVGVTMTNNGTGYTSVPTVSFSGGPGSGAVGVARTGCNNFADRVISLFFSAACTVNTVGGAGAVILKGGTLAADGGTVLVLRGQYGSWYEVSRGLKT